MPTTHQSSDQPADQPAGVKVDRKRRADDRFIEAVQPLLDSLEKPTPCDADIMELLDAGLVACLDAVQAKDGSLLVLDEGGKTLVFVISKGELPPEKLRWRTLPVSYGIVGWVARRQQASIVNDIRWDQRVFHGFDEEFDFATDSALAAPIIRDNRTLGVVQALNRRGDGLFTNGDLWRVRLFCHLAAGLLQPMLIRSATQRTPEEVGHQL